MRWRAVQGCAPPSPLPFEKPASLIAAAVDAPLASSRRSSSARSLACVAFGRRRITSRAASLATACLKWVEACACTRDMCMRMCMCMCACVCGALCNARATVGCARPSGSARLAALTARCAASPAHKWGGGGKRECAACAGVAMVRCGAKLVGEGGGRCAESLCRVLGSSRGWS